MGLSHLFLEASKSSALDKDGQIIDPQVRNDLSPQELRVLTLVMQGKSRREIEEDQRASPGQIQKVLSIIRSKIAGHNELSVPKMVPHEDTNTLMKRVLKLKQQYPNMKSQVIADRLNADGVTNTSRGVVDTINTKLRKRGLLPPVSNT